MTNQNTNPDYYKDELYLDEDFRTLAKTYPADVSAIGVTVLIDYVEALEAELARLTAELAELRERTRWIPVSERLPEIDDGYCIEVWAVNMNSLKPMAFRVDYTNFDGFETLIATHWMPIEAPKNLPPPEDK